MKTIAQQNLFTEKQVRQAMQEARNAFNTDKGYDEILKSLPPIEIPSDKEIEKEVEDYLYKNNKMNFINGAKWMKEQILNKNK